MSNLSEQEAIRNSTSSFLRFLYILIWVLVVLALTAGIILLFSDIFTTMLPHAPVSAAPLLLIGIALLGFQVLVRPGLVDLSKAFIVSSAFILWGIDQLLPPGWLATTIGDIVIVLYVIDIAWMMADRLRQQWQTRHTHITKSEYNTATSTHKTLLHFATAEPSKRDAP